MPEPPDEIRLVHGKPEAQNLTRSEFETFEKDLAARPHLLIWEK